MFAGQLARDTQLSADAALDAARNAKPGWRPSALFLATTPPARGERASERPAATWRVQLRHPQTRDVATVLVNDRDGSARSLPDPLAGDRAAQWIRFLHDGSRGGPVWQTVVFLTGAFPPVFAVTGIIMWLRRRRNRAAVAKRPTQEVMQAAE